MVRGVKKMRKLAVAALAVLLTAGAVVVEAEDKKPNLKKLEGELRKGLAAGDAALVVKTVDEIATADDEDAMKLLLNVALKADDIEKLKPEAANQVYDACRAALAKITDKKAEEFLYKNVQSNRDWRVRVVLAEVCGQKVGVAAGSTLPPAAEDALIALVVDDKEAAVRITAVKALVANKSVKAMDTYISVLAKVEKKREDPWLDLLRALRAMTGQDLVTADEWKGWWDVNKATYDPKKQGGGAASGDVGATVARNAPKLFDTEVLSKRCVFILDVSGSMAIKDPANEGGKPAGKPVEPKDPGYNEIPQERMRMWRLRDAMVKVIEALPEDTRFTIVTFSSQIRKWNEELVPANPKNKADAIEFSRGMQPLGFTWTDTAIEQAFEVKDANSFYLFTDGVPQRAKGEYIDKNEILAQVRQWNRVRKVKIFTIGIGEADSTFLARLAQENDGKASTVK